MPSATSGVSRRAALKFAGAGLTAGLAGCVSSFTDGGGPTDDFKLGFSTFTTGPYSIFGQDVRAAVEILAAEWNEKGGLLGQNVDISFVDTKADPTRAIEKARELIDEEEVNTLGTYLSSPELRGQINEAKKGQVPLVSTGSGGDFLLEFCNKYTFRGPAANSTRARAGAGTAVNELGTDAFILSFTQKYGKEVRDFWTDEIEAAGGRVVGTKMFEEGASDFSSAMSPIESADPDWVLVGQPGSGQVAYLKQANQQGFTYPTVGHIVYEQVIKAVGQDVLDNIPVFGVSSYVLTLDNEANNTFTSTFENETGRKPTGPAGQAYRHLDAFFRSVDANANSFESDELVSAFEGSATETITGPYEMRACDHQGKFDMFFVEVTGIENEFPVMDIKNTVSRDGLLKTCEEYPCNL